MAISRTHKIKATRLPAYVLLALAAGCNSPDGIPGALGAWGAGGARGEAGVPGPQGPTGPGGPQGPAAPVTGEIDGLVVAAATGQPLGGAQIAPQLTSLTATSTVPDGTFKIPQLPPGVYVLYVSLPGYLTQTASILVGVDTTTHVTIALATDTSSSGGLVVAVQDNLVAGYDSPVTLAAQVTTAAGDASGVTYAWTQTGGTPAQLTGLTTASASFRTLRLSDVKLEANASASLGPYDGGGLVPGRFGPMSLGIDETGNYQLALTVSDPAGHSATTHATVWATPPTSGLRSVPFGVPAWFEGDALAVDGGPTTGWSWSLVAPSGSKAVLAGTSSQFPSFTPDVAGSYTVTETVSGKSATVYAAGWDGVAGIASQPGTGNDYTAQNCIKCHGAGTQFPHDPDAGIDAAPDIFPAWAATRHAVAFSDGLDGKLGPAFGPSCLQCHTVGYSPVPLGNGGFADQAAKDGWTLPATLDAGNYAALVAKQPDLAQKGGVQCESCHGPKNLDLMGYDDTAAVSFGAGVCAQCHSQGTKWKDSLHANLKVAINEGVGSANCARCHSAQGFAEYAQELRAGCVAAGSASCLLTADGNPPVDGGANAATPATFALLGLTADAVQPQTCSACHDPHDVAGNPYQLRLFDSVPTTLMNGQAIGGVGAGAVCMTCHNSRPSFAEIDDGTLAKNGLTASSTLLTPHNGTQTDVLYGANAYFMPPATPSPHLAVAGTCAGCHALPTATQKAAGLTENHSFITDLSICSNCHAKAFDGASIQAQTTAQLEQVDQAIFSALGTLLSAAGTYNTTVRDAVTLDYLCVTGSGAPNAYLPLSNVPATYVPFTQSAGPPAHQTPWRALSSVEVTFATNPFTAMANLAECASASSPQVIPGVLYQGGPVVLSVSAAQAGPTHVASNPPLVSAISITGRAIYNEALVNNDLSLGVHNLPFTQTVLTNTLTQLATVTAGHP